jgi:hypothetical protein
MEQLITNQGRDPQLMELARRRASFKYHSFSYLMVNTFLWVLWFISSSRNADSSGFPWPLYPMLGWGIGLFFHYVGAYVFPKQSLVEREYEKLAAKRDINL